VASLPQDLLRRDERMFERMDNTLGRKMGGAMLIANWTLVSAQDSRGRPISPDMLRTARYLRVAHWATAGAGMLAVAALCLTAWRWRRQGTPKRLHGAPKSVAHFQEGERTQMLPGRS
jgi:hypothetical protein